MPGTLHPRPATVCRREGRASAAPRSGSGTSMRSKSRGTTVRGNSWVASAAISAAGVPRREVRQREQSDVRLARDERSLACGRVLGLAGAGRARPRGTSPRGRARRRPTQPRRPTRPARCRRSARRPVRAVARPQRPPPARTTRPSSSVTVSPRCRAPRAGPSGTPSAFAASTSNRPGRLVLAQRVAERVPLRARRRTARCGSRPARSRRRRRARRSRAGTSAGRSRSRAPRGARACRAGRER